MVSSVYFVPKPILPGIVWITIDLSEQFLEGYINNQLCDAPGAVALSKRPLTCKMGGRPAKRVLDMPGPMPTENILVKQGHSLVNYDIVSRQIVRRFIPKIEKETFQSNFFHPSVFGMTNQEL